MRPARRLAQAEDQRRSQTGCNSRACTGDMLRAGLLYSADESEISPPVVNLRSRQTRWFEVFVRREQMVYALEALAGTYSVELELDPRLTGSLNTRELSRQLREFELLATPYRELLPPSADQATRLMGAPDEIAQRMVRRLREWIERLKPVQQAIDESESRLHQLQLLREAVAALGEDAVELPQLKQSSDLLYKGLFACPRNVMQAQAYAGLIEQLYPGETHDFIILACLREEQPKARQVLSDAGCAAVELPEGLPDSLGEQRRRIEALIKETRSALATAKGKLDGLRHDRYMAEALANIETLNWFTSAAHAVGEHDAKFCHITGWTSEPDSQRLEAVLQNAHVDAEVRFTDPPGESKRPVRGAANSWAQPFQVFTAMWGPPSPDEVDPTPLLAFVVPLLFGYMFPDTGHGLVIAAVGFIIARRTPKARFLINCGIAAALMGLVFDDFFGYPMLDQPWQLHALDNPIVVLAIPIFFGIGLLLLGLVFNGVEAYWRGELRKWVLSEAAVLVLYISLLLTLLHDYALLAAAFALLWYLLGSTLIKTGKPGRAVSAAAGHLLHSTLTLVLNTISFVRVGAFALAHEGLSFVVMTLTGAIDNIILFVLAFVIGHAVVIALEGLVVFVQTTRLVLFEFFMQFLHAEGRFFRPLSTARPGPRQRD